MIKMIITDYIVITMVFLGVLHIITSTVYKNNKELKEGE